MQKLALLLPAGTVAHEQVREAVLDVARYDVFSLGEALLEGDVLRLARMIDGLRSEGTAPPLVLWAIAEEIRTIGRVLEAVAAGKTPSQMWRDLKVWGSNHQALMQQNLRRYSREQVEAGILHAARVDRIVKGLIRGDVWDELLQLALRFAASAPAKPVLKRGKMAAAASAAERNQPALF